jgi:hypothetical protein
VAPGECYSRDLRFFPGAVAAAAINLGRFRMAGLTKLLARAKFGRGQRDAPSIIMNLIRDYPAFSSVLFEVKALTKKLACANF